MRVAKVAESDAVRGRTHAQIVREAQMANAARLDQLEKELRDEIRSLRRDLEESREETAKASRCYAELWLRFHQQQVQQCEGH